MLDLGAGDGRHTVEICRWPCRAVAVELDVQLLRLARAYLPTDEETSSVEPPENQNQGRCRGQADFILADAQHLPFRDEAFDKVLCTEVLEHIPDDKEGIEEIYRVAKAGADVAVSVPRYWPERIFWILSWEYWHTPGGHVRMYRPGEMAGYLRERGFELQKTRYRHAFQAIYWFLRCTFGKNSENRLLPRTMFRFNSWYHSGRPKLIERVEAALNLILGKDMILYNRKPALVANEKRSRAQQPVQETQAPR